MISSSTRRDFIRGVAAAGASTAGAAAAGGSGLHQHPGELTGDAPDAPGVFGQEATYTSWWPEGNRTAGINPSTPRPATVVISRA